MSITAAQVKELRERTGAGMMECKKALTETAGDIEAAIDLMRKSGQAKAAKKAGRIAAEGRVVMAVSPDGQHAVMVEVNSETDFVAKDASFIGFTEAVADCLLRNPVADVEALLATPLRADEAATVEQAREALVAKLGENMNVRRFVRFDAASGHALATYLHGVRIGVLVEYQGGSDALGKDVAMHVAATNPLCVSPTEIPAERLQREREIFSAQALESGKPANIVEKMVEGRVRKFYEEVTLLGQPFVKDTEQTVEKVLKQANAAVVRFHRLEVGEGIEKKSENFAEEVAAQARSFAS